MGAIITVNDPMGARHLIRKAQPVGRHVHDVKPLIDGMVNVMIGCGGIGLAANQVGVDKRVCIVELGNGQLHTLIDPEIVSYVGMEMGIESCLSIPGVNFPVPRYTSIVVKAKNRAGKGITITASGELARAIQHEVDHLNGILIAHRSVAFFARLKQKRRGWRTLWR